MAEMTDGGCLPRDLCFWHMVRAHFLKGRKNGLDSAMDECRQERKLWGRSGGGVADGDAEAEKV